MTHAEGEPGKLEAEALAKAQLTPEDFRRTNVLKAKGARRPLRVKPEEVSVAGGGDEHGPHVTVAFTLPAGSFATMLMRDHEAGVAHEAASGAGGGTMTLSWMLNRKILMKMHPSKNNRKSRRWTSRQFRVCVRRAGFIPPPFGKP